MRCLPGNDIQESLIPLKREGKEWEHSNGEYTFENENIHMRPATEDDIENMYQWEMESIDKSLVDNEKVQSLIRQDCHDSLKDTLMIMDGDNTIGMFTACMIDDGEWRYIGEIYLIPEYRGQGIGSTILRNEMANYDKIRLQVAMDNEGAFKLYTSLGFKIAKEDDTNKMYIMEYVKPESIQEAVTIDGYRLIELAYMDKFPNMSPEQEAVLKDYSNARDQLVAAASYYKREKNARKKALKRIQLQHNTSDSEYFKNQCNQKMAVIRQEIEVLDKEYAEAYQRNVATMNQLADEFDKLETQKQQAGGNNTTAPKPSNSGYPDSITIPLPRIPRPSELLGKFLNAQEDTQL
jgi:ribosomal protein S18 acetylase RimI-like enzyme